MHVILLFFAEDTFSVEDYINMFWPFMTVIDLSKLTRFENWFFTMAQQTCLNLSHCFHETLNPDWLLQKIYSSVSLKDQEPLSSLLIVISLSREFLLLDAMHILSHWDGPKLSSWMGPLQLAVTWYKIRHAGEQAVHWDIQNKATSSR